MFLLMRLRRVNFLRGWDLEQICSVENKPEKHVSQQTMTAHVDELFSNGVAQDPLSLNRGTGYCTGNVPGVMIVVYGGNGMDQHRSSQWNKIKSSGLAMVVTWFEQILNIFDPRPSGSIGLYLEIAMVTSGMNRLARGVVTLYLLWWFSTWWRLGWICTILRTVDGWCWETKCFRTTGTGNLSSAKCSSGERSWRRWIGNPCAPWACPTNGTATRRTMQLGGRRIWKNWRAHSAVASFS